MNREAEKHIHSKKVRHSNWDKFTEFVRDSQEQKLKVLTFPQVIMTFLGFRKKEEK